MLEQKYVDEESSYSELEAYVNTQCLDLEYFRFANSNPIAPKDITKLKNQGWEIIIYEPSVVSDIQLCSIDPDEKSISMGEPINPYTRDKMICHEIVHAVYGEISMDGIRRLTQEEVDNGIITEWIGRKIRADSDILARIFTDFSIPPKIYDLSSYLAAKQISHEHPDLEIKFPEETCETVLFD
ncbi:hypothetical protein GOV12_05120 [Candidatus Pacearchaeota archaeon]|nr:hypothetical protein [Candidatus Pacearchaeota archaeon]